MTYKPELDGLRTVAIFLVLCMHMEIGNVTGGFIGVDIFFVLSGFLITSIIVDSMAQNKFNFLNFYARRFVRLYPALLTVVLLTFIASFLIADPETMKHMARTGRYVLFSISNIFFYQNLGYFDLAAPKQIFLHTWSLGVEWQFYMIWPIIIWSIFKVTQNRRVLITTLIIITIVSLIVSQWAVTHSPKAAYYMVYSRGFQLGIGGLLTFIYPKALTPKQGVCLVAIGMVTILAVSCIFYTSQTPFPGLAGLVPCLAAAACVWGSKAFSKGNFFKWRWMVYLGKASYSIYLVHWPLLVLSNYYLYRNLSFFERVSLIIASIALGCLIYETVEKNINWRKLPNKRLGIAAMLMVTLVSASALYYTSKKGDGLPWRLSEENTLLEAQYNDWGIGGFGAIATLGNPQGQTLALIGGDSFAANMSTGLHNNLIDQNLKIERYYEPGCLMSLTNLDGFDFTSECRTLSEKFIRAVQEHPELPVILIQAWGGPAVDADTRGMPYDPAAQEHYNQQIAINLDDLRQRFGEDRPIFLVAAPPYRHWGSGEKDCLLRPDYLSQACNEMIPPYPPEQAPVRPANVGIQAYAQEHDNVYYIETSQAACPDGICTSEYNAQLYFDGFHTSVFGADIVAKSVLEQIQTILEENHQP